jgi:hypothetical protein
LKAKGRKARRGGLGFKGGGGNKKSTTEEKINYTPEVMKARSNGNNIMPYI